MHEHGAVLPKTGYRAMRLHLRMDHRGKAILPFHHTIRRFHSRIGLAFTDLEMLVGIMPLPVHIRKDVILHQLFMQHWGGDLFCLPRIQYKGQNRISNLNFLEGAPGFLFAARHHDSHRLAHKAHLLSGNRMLILYGYPKGTGYILPGYYFYDARHSVRLRCIDG